MNVFQCIFKRRSIRKFKKKPIDDKLVGLVLHAAIHAPSSGNVQEWEFVVVKDEEKKKKLAVAALHQGFIKEAPVVIVVCADIEKIKLRYGKRGENLYFALDTGAAIQNILLSAHELGLGSCWIGAFDEEHVKEILELPENSRPLAIIPIGYPDEEPEMPKRIPFENLTSLNSYGNKFKIEFEHIVEYIKKGLKKISVLKSKTK
jgi:nitroreductase